jgi:hypothetical protein
MKTHVSAVGLVGFVLGLVAFISTAAAQGTQPDAAVKKTFDKMLGAIQANDRDAFVADATDAVKKSITQKVMEGLNGHMGARLKQGYDAIYLCQLKQQGLQIHLWKIAFKDGSDDIVIRIALKQGKVDGFFLQ